jgi:hypothetical protein
MSFWICRSLKYFTARGKSLSTRKLTKPIGKSFGCCLGRIPYFIKSLQRIIQLTLHSSDVILLLIMKSYYYRWQRFIFTCRRINAILHCLNRQDELQRLIQWADRKKLSGPCRAYNTRLDDEEHRLFRYQLSVPHLIGLARILHTLKIFICPAQPYYTTGYAAAIGAANLDR